jgi:hypothetical protein
MAKLRYALVVLALNAAKAERMSAVGPKLPSWKVRYSVAMGGKADMRGHRESDVIDPEPTRAAQFCCDAQERFFSPMW